MKPWVSGASFAVTIGFIYIACALAVVLFPDGTLNLFNTWAHGIDLTTIKRAPSNTLTFNDWGVGFGTAIAAAFIVGALYQWAHNFFAGLGRTQA